MKKILQTLVFIFTIHTVMGQTGTVGIGTNTPSQQLDVNGWIKLGDQSSPVPPNTHDEGSIRYNSTSKTIQVNTGGTSGNWVGLLKATDAVPAGVICMWSGSFASIPSGWSLCDGTAGTPDLRDKFILGATITTDVGDVGGSNTHTITTSEMPSHTHTGTTASTAPILTFAGTAATVSPTATFTGTAATISPTAAFTGTAATISPTAAFTGTAATISPTAAFTGTASNTGTTAPTFTGTGATITPSASFTGTAAATGNQNQNHDHSINTGASTLGNSRIYRGSGSGTNQSNTEGQTFNHNYTPAGNVTVTGASYTPAGNVSTHTHSFTPAGNIAVTGAGYTPAGNVAVTGAGYTPAGNVAVTGAGYTPAGNVAVTGAGYTPAGNIAVTGASYTPAGTVAVTGASYTPAGTVAVTGANYTPAGTISGSSHTHTFTTGATGSGTSIDTRPSFYKLAYIMKL